MTSERGQGVGPPAGRRGGAFSLIEVMLGVLILALGLLGLAAVMPAVVAQQRTAANTTLGVSVIESAKSYIAQRTDFNRVGRRFPTGDQLGIGVWHFNDFWSRDYEWAAPVEVDEKTGTFSLGVNPQTDVVIPVGERLWPSPGSGRGAPMFVWDFSARRVPSNWQLEGDDPDTLKPEIEIVVFVRRIDPGIRPSGGKTLWNLLVDPSDPFWEPDFLAVGEQMNTGLPTLNGTGVYSLPKRLDVRFDPLPGESRTRLVLLDETSTGFIAMGQPNGGQNNNDAILRNLASTPGQKLVDNLGNIHTVIGPDPDDPDAILLADPVPAWVNTESEVGLPGVEVWDSLHQVIFTPQIPAAVEVFRLRAANPKE